MKVIGIKFKEGGKIYYFAPRENEQYEEGMQVIVETSKSVEFALVAFPPREVEDGEVTQPLKPIVRIATERDREQQRRNAERRPQAMKQAQEKIEKHGLDMKLIDCEFAFDGSKVIFYFSSENRVDFRELVKDLAGLFRCRIELRQIGIRDETRLLGGIAPCGRECCCAGAMPEFRKVSIKMAKVQGLSLNPGKISGLCGRLMCCLGYENEYYSEAYKLMPKVGAEVGTPEGNGIVVSNNMLKYIVRVKIEKDGSLVYKDFPLAEIGAKDTRPAPVQREGESVPREGRRDEFAPREGRREGQERRREGEAERRAKGAPREDGQTAESGEGARQGKRRSRHRGKGGQGEPRKGQAQEGQPRERQNRRDDRPRGQNGPRPSREGQPPREGRAPRGGGQGQAEGRAPREGKPRSEGGGQHSAPAKDPVSD